MEMVSLLRPWFCMPIQMLPMSISTPVVGGTRLRMFLTSVPITLSGATVDFSSLMVI